MVVPLRPGGGGGRWRAPFLLCAVVGRVWRRSLPESVELRAARKILGGLASAWKLRTRPNQKPKKEREKGEDNISKERVQSAFFSLTVGLGKIDFRKKVPLFFEKDSARTIPSRNK